MQDSNQKQSELSDTIRKLYRHVFFSVDYIGPAFFFTWARLASNFRSPDISALWCLCSWISLARPLAHGKKADNASLVENGPVSQKEDLDWFGSLTITELKRFLLASPEIKDDNRNGPSNQAWGTHIEDIRRLHIMDNW